MSRLIFNAKDVQRIVEHSIGREQRQQMVDFDRKTFEPIMQPVAEAAVRLVHDHGVYLISNAVDRDLTNPSDPNSRSFVAYAKGCSPDTDKDWWDTARDLVGGDDFCEVLPWAEAIKLRIDARARAIVINYGRREISFR